MAANVEFLWYCIFFFIVTAVSYMALQRIDHSKIFKANSTWQIIVLNLFVSLGLGFLVSQSIITLINLIMAMF